MSILNGSALNQQQKKIVSHTDGPALVLAGPGSGKTTVIIFRQSYLIIEKGVSPRSILSMTFNKQAAVEMDKRFRGLLLDFKEKNIYNLLVPEKPDRFDTNAQMNMVECCTMHSFCYKILRDYEKLKNKKFFLIEGGKKLSVLADIYRNVVGRQGIEQEELDNLMNEIGFVKNRMITDVSKFKSNIRNFEIIYKAYDAYKRENLFIDFDDMLVYAYRILLREPSILNRLRNRYKYIQVDEGQDTSKIQLEIIRLLSYPDNNIFIVADDDQSIYSFRGAEPIGILKIPQQYPDCVVYHLDTNYRSSKNIVETTSSFIKSNTMRFDKQHNTINDYKTDPLVVVVRDEKEQLDFLTNIATKFNNKSVAIVYRNNVSGIAVADCFESRGINFDMRQSKLNFFTHRVVLDIKAFLIFALNQSDSTAFLRICYSMNRYLSRNMIEYATARLNDYPGIIDAMLTMPDLKTYQIKTLKELKFEFKRLSGKAPLEALKYIKEDFRYFKRREEQDAADNNNSVSIFSALCLIASNCSTLMQFIERLDFLKNLLEQSPEQNSRVVLSTIHACKGQEFDTVVMIDLINDDFPGVLCLETLIKNNDRAALEEERRLFYVGMTRAREMLYLVCPKKKNGVEVLPTMFVQEVINLKQPPKVFEKK